MLLLAPHRYIWSIEGLYIYTARTGDIQGPIEVYVE